MTDSRKLTDNELEQVAGGGRDIGGFSIGNYVELSSKGCSDFKIVYRIDTLNGINATATMYEKISDGVVITTTDQSINLKMGYTKLDPTPDWVPAN